MEEKKMVLTSRKALEIMKPVCPSINSYTADMFLLRMPDWEADAAVSERLCFMTMVHRDEVAPEHQKNIKGSARLVALMVEVEHPEKGAFFLDLDDLLRSWDVFVRITVKPDDTFQLSDGTKCRYNLVSQACKNRFLNQIGIVGSPQRDDSFITLEPDSDEPKDDDEL